ncbi:MAG: CRISPR-associated helicase Cas3' [Intestinibacter sp.]|uniref:CRISPR-associated helicase Cas3' n=1 Tax=Intestinibacter sp. TaxID=1965304 RepID=UPI003F18D649
MLYSEIENKLDKYKAKSDNTSILQHNHDLMLIKDQIVDIYNLDKKMVNSLEICIECHDVGKVVDSYQSNIENKKRTIRHEILSASIKNLSDKQKLAIITHHKSKKEIKRFAENEFYEKELQEMASKLDIEVEDIRGFIKQIGRKKYKKLVEDIESILLKGYLQYCDHVASAGIKKIEKGFSAIDVFKFNKYNSIQNQVLNLKDREDILIIAPTGLGKTATSLFWSDLLQNKEKSKRIYYLLPYTASINSLYKNMSSKNISVSMMHSRAEYFLNKMEEDEDIKKLYNIFKKSVKQLNISTIYQIVKVIFSCKRYEMLLAQLKNSIFIVDEIHCFDIEQIALLLTTLKFLKEKLGISICIMSASIPSCLQNLICGELGISKIIKASEEDYKIRHKIYRFNKCILDDLDMIKEDLDNGKRIIVCVNSVALSQKLYMLLKDYKPKLIHGRFNTRDREKAEQNLDSSNLLIGTQAIEVSLDIDYDKMYTEIAPIDSLLQRFGRVNRYGEKGISDIFIYNKSNKIYSEEIIDRTDIVIKNILDKNDGIVLENETQGYLDQVYKNIDMKEYLHQAKAINDLIEDLEVAVFYDSASKDMCSFNTISVLPSVLLDEYENLIRNKRYLEANSLFVNMTYFKNEDEYVKKHVFENRDIYVIDLEYDERGLVQADLMDL